MNKIEIDIKALLDGMTKDQLRELVEECNKRIYKQDAQTFQPWFGIPGGMGSSGNYTPVFVHSSDSKAWPEEFQNAFDKDKQIRNIIGGNA